MLKHICPHSGCREIIPIGQRYCAKHQAERDAMEAQRQTHYNKTVRYTRDKKYHNFYSSPEWARMKAFILNKYHGLCVYSYLIEHKIVPAEAIHHIVEIKENWNLRLKEQNLIPLSNSVHSKISRLYLTDKKATQTMLYELLEQWAKG